MEVVLRGSITRFPVTFVRFSFLLSWIYFANQVPGRLNGREANRAGLTGVASAGMHEDPEDRITGLNVTPTSSVYFSLSFGRNQPRRRTLSGLMYVCS
jgi:hypothetical protein